MSHAASVAEGDESSAAVSEFHVGDRTVVTVITGGPWRQRCYIVVDDLSRQALVIDPGGRSQRIADEIRRRNLVNCGVLLTHGHHDHVGAVASICRDFDVTCFVAEEDARLLRQAPLYAFRFSGKKIEMPGPVEFLRTDKHRWGTHAVGIQRVPGHTDGGVVFQFPGFAMTGDTLLYRCVGRTDLPGGDATALRASVDALLSDLAPTTVLFPGHGRSWTVEEAREWWASGADAPPPLDDFGMLP
jgi:hydroxyacylglutathione hydrolase